MFPGPFASQAIERWSIGREAELAQLSRERAEARAQVEQVREQTRAAEMVNGIEKARMAKGLRNELELLASSRDDAISRANAAEGRSKT
jgi:cell division protein FtsB